MAPNVCMCDECTIRRLAKLNSIKLESCSAGCRAKVAIVCNRRVVVDVVVVIVVVAVRSCAKLAHNREALNNSRLISRPGELAAVRNVVVVVVVVCIVIGARLFAFELAIDTEQVALNQSTCFVSFRINCDCNGPPNSRRRRRRLFSSEPAR